ncbi:helix-turn-helix domain-containing protein [Bradyrhizobium brasilense]|uniref:helix-turn-helix domain-containing protein n=1 Tax=Bradyrhizobium brasilense TaxID=1419277 RepID=UPI0024B1B93A|nr:helix-turn-helix domain-containing protein [Bradyrhizobium australafricanum]WFU33853.1 helix-turn-helix domain-containing protein [Bradyrhizobium australafricanum]
MIAVRGRARIGGLVAKSGLSTSQFQRRFATEVGMTPKLLAQTIRFDRALIARRDEPNRPWTDIIHELGDFDQAHFIRECRALAGYDRIGGNGAPFPFDKRPVPPAAPQLAYR